MEVREFDSGLDYGMPGDNDISICKNPGTADISLTEAEAYMLVHKIMIYLNNE